MYVIFVKDFVAVGVDIAVVEVDIAVVEADIAVVEVGIEVVEGDTFEEAEAYKYLYVGKEMVVEEQKTVVEEHKVVVEEHKVVVGEKLDFDKDLEAYMY